LYGENKKNSFCLIALKQLKKFHPFHIIVLAWQFLNYNANLDELLAAFSG